VENRDDWPMSGFGVAEIVISGGVLGGIAGSWIAVIRAQARRERALLKEHARVNRATAAAGEAAEDDEVFAPEEIRRSIGGVLALAEAVWRSEDISELKDRPDAHMIRAWARSRESWMGSGLEAVGPPSIDLLRVVNRGDEAEDRVVARVRLQVHCKHPRPLGDDVFGKLVARRHVHLDERWTLGRSENRWILLSVDGDPLAGPVLTAPLIPTRSHDMQRLREESLAELASTQKVAEGVRLSDLVPAHEQPALALLDLSIVDGRFLPALIAAALAHLIEAWEEASTGAETPLEKLASSNARASLLRPGGDKCLIMRDAMLKAWEPTRLELSRQPPAVEVALSVDAIRYVATADGDYLAGNAKDQHRMTLTWLLELADDAQTPWRLAASNSPARDIPAWS
jgi:hypothetical protein